jgi:hypothetical protein
MTVATNQVLGIDIWNASAQFNTNADSSKAWLDFDAVVVISTNGIPPITTPVVTTPTNSVWGGETLTNIENCFGSTPLSYQWQSAVGAGLFSNIGGETASNLVFTTSTTAGTYRYQLIIINSVGSITTAPVVITVKGLTGPTITQDAGTYENGPVTNVLAYSGGSVDFYAIFDGPPVVTNQWTLGGVAIGGATTNLYTLNNAVSDGVYKYLGTNVYGSTNTQPVQLNVLAQQGAPDNIGTNMYTYCVYTNHPLAYWKFEETNDTKGLAISKQAYDYSGHNFDATYGLNCYDGAETLLYVGAGYHGPRAFTKYSGFPITNGCAGMGGDVTSPLFNGYLSVPPLNINTNNVTFTMWIYPNAATQPSGAGLFMNRNGSDAAGVGLSTMTNGLGTPTLGYTWNSNNAATYGWNTGLYPIAGIWSFVACVVTPTNTSMYLYYVNGASTNLLKSVFTMTNNPEAFGGIGATRIGGDSQGGDGRTFMGEMDEVAIFTNSMSEGQIQDLFLKSLGLNTGIAPSFTTQPVNPFTMYAGTTLRLSAAAGGIPNPAFQWQYSTNYGVTGTWWTNVVSGGTITGGNSNVLTITGFPANSWVARTNFALVVTNNYGSVTSSVANIVVLRVPGNNNSQTTDPLWTVNYAVATTNGGGLGNPFNGHGVLGTGSYWNALGTNGTSQMTNTTSFLDDGLTVSGVNLISQTNVGITSSLWRGVPTNNLLLDTFATLDNVTATPFVFSPIPNGRYNLAVYASVGSWADRAAKITVLTNGVSAGTQGVTNLQDSMYVAGDSLVIFTNLAVLNHSLEMDIVFLSTAAHTNTASGEADFNGAQLQFLKIVPAITSFNPLTRTLSWEGGLLSSATNIMGPWTTNSFTSPFTMNPTGHMQFFRIYNPTF